MIEKVLIVDDFLSSSYYKEVEAVMLSNEFSWYFQDNITGIETNNPRAGFNHHFIKNGAPSSEHTSFLLPLLLQIQDLSGASTILRARGDMVLRTGEKAGYPAHIDIYEEPHMSAVFYIGDSDGDTIIYEETQNDRVSPPRCPPDTLTEMERTTFKPNRLVLFRGEHWHTGGPPLHSARRVIINSNYLMEEA